MFNRLFSAITVTGFILLLLLFNLNIPAHSQNTVSDKKQKFLIQAIQKKAKQDAEAGKKQEGIQELHLLFGDEAKDAGLKMRKIVEVYEAAKKAQPWWKAYKPNFGWIAASVLFILLIFRDIIKETIANMIKSVKKRIYNRVAGHRFFLKTALRHYQQALLDKYKQIKIPFRPDRPLNMHEVYVPLKVKGTRDAEQFDVYQAMAKDKRLMVTGPPGSGKSMLLKSIALAYSEGRLINLPGQPIPILLELNRLNESDMPVKDHLVEMLRLNDFPKADNFVSLGLKQGELMLLFDGLDEVNSLQREQVVKKIKDLLDEYEKCSTLITCRTAVYNQEFAETVDRTLDIVEFSDQQIRLFLTSWREDMPADKSIEQLINTLRDRPRIMALARNPLMLTIIAYLYTDTEFVLPHSRAEFYDQATDVLLRQLKQERNRFKAPNKRLVLEHLALFNQDRGTQGEQDWRSIDRKTILREIKQILPDLNLADEETVPLLDEIVERSGLLISIDGGERYQFAHLTLQEYFAAAALENAEELVSRFKSDKTTWREVVKLWCGLANESTNVVQGVYEEDPITAFECLADAQKISPELADKIVNDFKARFGTFSKTDNIITNAFAITASDLRPRGKAIFDFLKETLETSRDALCHATAADALSLTNLPQAAEVLAKYSAGHTHVRDALIRMGDLAVPALIALAKSGSVGAMDDLQAIGTPKAAQELLPLLWDSDQTLAEKAAWRLAAMLPKPNIETVLRDYTLSETQKKSKWLDWIWEPFGEGNNSVIAGRIAFLIDQASLETAPEKPDELDQRIVIPLCSVKGGSEIIEIQKKFSKLGPFDSESDYRNLFNQTLIIKSRWHYMFNALPFDLKFDLFNRLGKGPQPIVADWRNVFKPLEYEFNKSWHRWIFIIIVVIISLIAYLQMASIIFFSSTPILRWQNGLILALFILSYYNLSETNYDITKYSLDGDIYIFCTGPILPVIGFIDDIRIFGIKEAFEDKYMIDELYDYGAWLPIVGYFTTVFLLSIFSWKFTLFIQLTWWIIMSGTLWIAMRRERLAQNPLHGILDAYMDRPMLAQAGRKGWFRLKFLQRLR